MRYLPLTPDDRTAMLAAIGAKSIDDLFVDVPESARLQGPVDLPRVAGELEVERALSAMAAKNAAETIKQRLVDFLVREYKVTPEDVEFRNGQVRVRDHFLSFEEMIQKAYFGQVSLSSTGFYRTPKIYYDRDKAAGRPFYYYAYGVACEIGRAHV